MRQENTRKGTILGSEQSEKELQESPIVQPFQSLPNIVPPPPPPPSQPVTLPFPPWVKMTTPRLLNVAPYPMFYGLLGTDPNQHIDRFKIVAIANQLPTNLFLSTFPSTLLGGAGRWYSILPNVPLTWDALCKEFLLRFRPKSFRHNLIDRVCTIKMGPHETIDAYYTRMNSLLHR